MALSSQSLKRTLTLMLLICVVSGAFFVGRTLGASSQSSRVNNVVVARRDAVNSSDLTTTASHAQDPSSNVPPADVFEEVLSNIQRNFVEINDIPLSKIDAEAITRMYASLGDPKTHALNGERRRARQSALQGKYYGMGANLAVTRAKKADVDYSHLTVVSVMPGSPAEKAGLRSGDYITELDGRWIINYTLLADADRISHQKYKDDTARDLDVEQVRQKFKAGVSLSKTLDALELGEGSPHALTVDRQGQTLPQKVSLTTALTRVDPVEYKTLGSIGYLRIHQFNPATAEAFEAALDKATNEKGEKEPRKGLIVDLRQNPGGVTADAQTGVDGYGAARKLIARLTGGGSVAAIERKPRHRETLTVTPAAPALKMPLVVLIDGGTANLAELVASALRDAGKAKLVGSRTFGDDALQLFALLKNGMGVEITTAHLFTRDGADLARGLEPDIPVSGGTDSKGANDPALQRALALLGA